MPPTARTQDTRPLILAGLFAVSAAGAAFAQGPPSAPGAKVYFVNLSDGEEELLYAVPTDDNHLHFGGGQTEAMVELGAGAHTLQLVPGDRSHVPHTPPVVSEVITVTVELPAARPPPGAARAATFGRNPG